jgi:hypothetical protein
VWRVVWAPRASESKERQNEYFKLKKNIFRAQHFTLLSETKRSSINSRDFIKVMISVRGCNCDFTPRAPKKNPSYATAVMTFMGELHTKVKG